MNDPPTGLGLWRVILSLSKGARVGCSAGC